MADSILDGIFAGSNGIAAQLIGLLGGDASITLSYEGSYNPLTGEGSEVTPTATAIDLSMLEQVSEREINDTTILRGDYKCIIPADDVTLERKNINHSTITFNGTVYKIVEYRPVFSGQEIAMYTVYLRNT